MSSSPLDESTTFEGRLATRVHELFAVSGRIDAIESRLASLENSSNEQLETHDRAARVLDRLGDGLAVLAQKSQCLEQASREQARMGERHYQEHVIEPLAHQLFPMFDILKQARAKCPDTSPRHQYLTALASLVDELLGRYGIESYESSDGTPYDAKTMRATHTSETYDSRCHDTIAKTLQTGFRRGSRILRYQSVVIYRLIHGREAA